MLRRSLVASVSAGLACRGAAALAARPILAAAASSSRRAMSMSIDMHGTSRPATPAYFTGNAKYYDLVQELTTRLGGAMEAAEAVETIKANPAAYDAVRRAFKSRDVLMQEMALTLSEQQYETLVLHLLALRVGALPALAPITADPETPEGIAEIAAASKLVHDAVLANPVANSKFLVPFLNKAAVAAESAAPKVPDAFGRAVATGSRKTSRAVATVVPGNGQYFVNGTPIADYFLRREVESASFPLQVAKAYGKYNVWAVVNGGGPTGQAEATAVAVARALAVHEPAARDDLEAAALLDNDTRQVERKKPGQKKARKKFAWVKR
ncbi:37S ribosomal protein S9, mitochondrial [Blastocladiella emersonii ATCC 22665]|nr:37S ribosomal protein S9, mitochondrial [Blastocladiella emersonii ATCC 22665]